MKVSSLVVAIVCAVCLAAPISGYAATIDLTGTIRDFNDSHPDFEDEIAYDPGIVETILGVDSKPVYASATGTPTTTSKEYFDQWYRDVAGVNMNMPYTITLANSIAQPNIYSYSNSSFFPINNQLLGNQGRGQNYHFTYELHTSFTYQGGESFSFTGDDDLWVFINDQLAIDLGGVHGAMSSSVNLDTLGLTIGNDYDLDLFFAERHTSQSNFYIQTSLLLRDEDPNTNPVPEPATLAFLGTGILSAFIRLKKRT